MRNANYRRNNIQKDEKKQELRDNKVRRTTAEKARAASYKARKENLRAGGES